MCFRVGNDATCEVRCRKLVDAQGAIFVDHTASAVHASWRRRRERDLGFLDAPVSGGQAALKRAFTVMAGGEPSGLLKRSRSWLRTLRT